MFTSSAPAAALSVGAAVTVTGAVEEFGFETDPAITEITTPMFAAEVMPATRCPRRSPSRRR